MKRKSTLLIALLLAAATLLTGCRLTFHVGVSGRPGLSDTATEPDSEMCADFDAFLDDLFLNEISLDTISLHFTVKDPSIYHLEDMTPCWTAPEDADRYPINQIAAGLSRFDPDLLTPDRRTTFYILWDYCRYSAAMSTDAFALFSTYLDMNNGVHTAIPVNLAEYEFYREKDVTDFLSLIEQLPDYMDTIIEWETLRVEEGYGPSDKVLYEIIEKCEEILSDEEFYLISVFAERIDAADFLTDSQKESYKARERELIGTSFMQAFKNLETALESFLGKGQNDKGLADMPYGAEYYEAYVNYRMGTNYTCEEMIEILEKDYEALYQQLYDRYMEAPGSYDRFFQGEDEIPLRDPSEILEYIRPKMEGIFPAIEGDSYEIRYLPKSMEKVMDGVLAYYTIPQVDNFLTGRITINGGAGDDSELFNTVAHEGYPGHMYQTIYFYSQNPANIRKMLSCTGYSEGWAYYAADIAYTLYDFGGANEWVSSMYRLNDNLTWNLSCRLDIGINYEGWGVYKVGKYMEEHGLDPAYAQDLFDSMVGSPGVYLPYYMGYLEFRDMQSYAQKELGSAYDPVAFHAAVLSEGSCPFKYVWDAVDAYIKETKK